MNMPLGIIKNNLLIQDDDPPVAVDIEKGVAIRLSPVMYHLLTQYGQSRWKDILAELRKCYTWSEIQSAVMHLVELAELGLIFTDGNCPRPTEMLRPHMVVAPGFIRNRSVRSALSNATSYALLNCLSQRMDLSIYVGLDEADGVIDALEEACPHAKFLRHAPSLSHAAVAELPIECDAILIFSPLHPEDLQFLRNRQCPILLFVSSYGNRQNFNNLSPAYSSLRGSDIWLCPQFWIENRLRQDFPNLQHLYPMLLGIDSYLVESLPAKAALKRSLSQVFDNEAFQAAPAIGVFGDGSETLTEQLAQEDCSRLYVCITGSAHQADSYYTFVVDDIQEANTLPHLLKGLDALIFIAQGTTEPYLLYLAKAVGTPVIVVGCDHLPKAPFFDTVYHCATLEERKILACLEQALEAEQTPTGENGKRESGLVAWEEAAHQLLKCYHQANENPAPMITAPRPPKYVFTRYYNPAQKRVTARAISLQTLESVPLEIGFIEELRQHHTRTEVDLILSHLGKNTSEIATLLDDYNLLFQL